MRRYVLRYLQDRILPALYSRRVTAQITSAKEKGLKASFIQQETSPGGSENAEGSQVTFENFERKYSPRWLLVLLVVSVVACGLLLKTLYLWFPIFFVKDQPLIISAILVAFLFPVLYGFFYRPMVRQFDKLRMAALMMRDLALIDTLTGLYNRRGFLIYAEHLLRLSDRSKRGLILIYADLDSMKRINDDFGHEEGDRALVTTADVLRHTFRNSDVIGRVGGDEFVILALEARAESLDALRRRLNANLKKTRYNANPAHKLTFSLGIIYYDPEKPVTVEELLRRADRLMYEEKQSGRPIVSGPAPLVV